MASKKKAVHPMRLVIDAAYHLQSVSNKVAEWFESAAKHADEQVLQNRGRFDSLADACAFDAKNYRAMARDLNAALQKCYAADAARMQDGLELEEEPRDA